MLLNFSIWSKICVADSTEKHSATEPLAETSTAINRPRVLARMALAPALVVNAAREHDESVVALVDHVEVVTATAELA